MKSILIATDFSANSRHAAEYGFKLAGQLKENVVLCNAFVVPAEVPEASAMVWPQYEYEELLKDSGDELKELENAFVQAQGKGFHPFIARISEDGPVPMVINKAAKEHDIHLIVMGTHGNTGLSGFMMGNHSRRMIDDAICPLLLVPAQAPVASIKKIAFATDFKEPEKDLEAIFELIPLLKKLNADLLLVHILETSVKRFDFQDRMEGLLLELSNKADYSHIYYRIVKSEKPEKGLDWLCQFGNVDVMAMVHRKHSFFDRLFIGSHTQKMADHISVPLLVLQQK